MNCRNQRTSKANGGATCNQLCGLQIRCVSERRQTRVHRPGWWPFFCASRRRHASFFYNTDVTRVAATTTPPTAAPPPPSLHLHRPPGEAGNYGLPDHRSASTSPPTAGPVLPPRRHPCRASSGRPSTATAATASAIPSYCARTTRPGSSMTGLYVLQWDASYRFRDPR